MKKLLKQLAVWYLEKYYPVTINGISIDTDYVKIKWGGFGKDDNNWHLQTASISCWVNKTKSRPMLDEIMIYNDTELVAKYLFENPLHQAVTYEELINKTNKQ